MHGNSHQVSEAVVDAQLSTSNADFKNPHSLNNKLGRLLWMWVYWTFYRWTPPRLAMFWRRLILQVFGARTSNAWIHPSVRIWAPWKLRCGLDTYIDRDVFLYNTYGIEIGDRVIISMGAVLCTPTHDYNDPSYQLCGGPIVIDSDSWIAAQAFISPGRQIGKGAVVGARSVVTRDVPAWTIVAGNPAKPIKQRAMSGQ